MTGKVVSGYVVILKYNIISYVIFRRLGGVKMKGLGS